MDGYIEIQKYHLLEVEFATFKKEADTRIEDLKFQLDNLKRMVFGAKSERYISNISPDQLALFDQVKQTQQQESPPGTTHVPAHDRKKGRRKEKPVRLVLPKHLEREEKIIEPDMDTTDMVKIGEERTETLAYSPAKLTVKIIVRPKYVATTDQDPSEPTVVQIAPMPKRFIDKCIADESLLSNIIIEKYVDHLPLYRIIVRMKRMGITIPRSTMCGWMAQSASKFETLYNKLVEKVLSTAYLQVDETRIEVQIKGPPKKARVKSKKRKTHRGFYWGYNCVHKKLLFFEYHPSREADNPMKRLKNFTGTVQTDAYTIYDQIRNAYPGLTHYHCLNHARREFEKALTNDQQRADHALREFQILYSVERQAKEENLDTHSIQKLREQKSKPVLERMFKWMETELPKLLPQSPIGKAMGYMLRRKKRMSHYLTDGNLLIDTNPIENAIRPIAVGRKNYLFAGSHEAAQRGAIFYSLLACCKMNEVDPLEWLTDIMQKLPHHPDNQIEQLLPHLWIKQKMETTTVQQETKQEL
jgi:transposase